MLDDMDSEEEFDDEGDLDFPEDDGEGDFDDWGEEISVEAGMLGGTRAYNEARGFDVDDEEPCGHHCDLSCPRCGGE